MNHIQLFSFNFSLLQQINSCTTKNECVTSGSSLETSSTTTISSASARNGQQQQQQQQQLTNNDSSRQFKWISSDSSGKCIDLQSIIPDKIPITSTGKVSFSSQEIFACDSSKKYENFGGHFRKVKAYFLQKHAN